LLVAWMPPPTGIVMCHCDVSESIIQRESRQFSDRNFHARLCLSGGDVSVYQAPSDQNGRFGNITLFHDVWSLCQSLYNFGTFELVSYCRLWSFIDCV
jgi:hypothetical protein